MKKGHIQNVLSESLLTKDVYGICFTERESLDCRIDNFFAARRRFLQSDKKKMKVNEKQIVMGMTGDIKIKLAAHNLFFKKTVGKTVIEESYQAPVGFVVVRRNLDNFITSKMFFDKNHQWIKSEYFDVPDITIAQVIFKPITSHDAIERFDYNPAIKGYSQTVLFPASYVENDAVCRVIDEKIGQPSLIVLTENGRFCYTPESIARKRLEMQKEIKTDDVQKILSWAEDPGTVKKAQADLIVSFSTIDEIAKVKKVESQQKPQVPKQEPQQKFKYESVSLLKNTLDDIPVREKQTQTPVKEIKKDRPLTGDALKIDKFLFKNVVRKDKLLSAEQRAKAGEQVLKEKEKPLKVKKTINIDKEFEEILKTAQNSAKKRYIKSQINSEKLFSNPFELKKEIEKNSVLSKYMPDVLEEKLGFSFDENQITSNSNIETKHEITSDKKLLDNLNTKEEKIGKFAKEPRPNYDLEKEFGLIVDKAFRSLSITDEVVEEPKKKVDERDVKKIQLKPSSPEIKINTPRQEIYRASVVDGKIAGITGSKKQNKESCYEGEMLEGKRHGFGVSYSPSGSVVYAGFWENDKKNGLGISFRESDHAVHIAHWNDNKPDSFVSLFDTKGNLQYSGSVKEGKKNGVGISYRLEDGSVFVGKWEKGKSTGFGSVFDKSGNLIYTGMWKNGKRNGIGSEFNEKGEVIFTGEWKDDIHHNGILYKRPDETKKITG